MPDVKNTINGLQQAIDIMRRIMPNQYWFDIETPCNDAIALLKAQEPRVMSVQEVKQLKHGVLVAYEARGLRLGDDGKHHMTIVCHAAEFETIDSRGVIWFHGGIGIEGFKNYGRVFRVWTSRPTDEQREAAPWQIK